jgi:hypothetical protein
VQRSRASERLRSSDFEQGAILLATAAQREHLFEEQPAILVEPGLLPLQNERSFDSLLISGGTVYKDFEHS